MGAQGAMQLMPDTAAELEKSLGMPPGETQRNPEANRQAGRAYLDQLMQKYGGDRTKALMAYNWGMGNLDNWLADPNRSMDQVPQETRDYVEKVTALATGGQGGGLSSAPAGGIPPATVPGLTPPAAVAGTPLQVGTAGQVAGSEKAAQLDAELDRSVALADAAGRKAAAEATAKGDVEFRLAGAAELPKMELALGELRRDIPNLINHPALANVVGDGLWGRLGNVPLNKIIEDMGLAGTPEADVIARLEQMKGQVFLPAFQFLRGGGQITNVEGDKAQAAMARLNRSQTPEDFAAAMQEFLQAYQDGYDKRVAVSRGEYSLSQFDPGGAKSATPPKVAPKRKAISPAEAAKRKALLDEF